MIYREHAKIAKKANKLISFEKAQKYIEDFSVLRGLCVFAVKKHLRPL
jgi:hypothetical protein